MKPTLNNQDAANPVVRYATINERGADRASLFYWLTLSKQGIGKDLAQLGIETLERELKKGKEPHKTCNQLKKFYKEIVKNPKVPEAFWIDNYVLLWCRDVEKLLIKDGVDGILNELQAEKASKHKLVILLIILNALNVLSIISLWIF